MSEPISISNTRQQASDELPRELPFFVARQPIYTKHRQIHAYEMLFRGLEDVGEARFLDGDVATAQLITQGWLLGGFEQLSGGRWLFVNFTRELLVGGAVQLFQPERDVVEVLEDIPADPQVLGVCRALIDGGYRVALDDIRNVARLREFEDSATLIKVDFLNQDPETITEIARYAQRHGMELLAEKIEDGEDLALANRLNFDYFQGYYLSRPESLQRPALPGLSPAHARLLQIVSSPELELGAVTRAVESDPSLTYKLLRSANSVARALNRRITSIREAVILFGEDEIRRAAAFVVMGAILDDTNHLLHESVTLAKFCDAIGERLSGARTDHAEFYLVGLLANIDSLLGQSMEEAVGRLPLSENVTEALIDQRGAPADVLALARAYMRGDWDTVGAELSTLELGAEELASLYVRAVAQSDMEMDAIAS